MLDESLIPLLRCPQTHQPLRVATEADKSAHGVRAESYALVTEDGKVAYREVNGLLTLLSATAVGSEG